MPSSIKYLEIEKYRSVNKIKIKFPEKLPLTLIGENNAGKSNIIRALDLILGESWAGTHEPEDHEFWLRNPQNGPIIIKVGLEGFFDQYGSMIEGVFWKYSQDTKKTEYKTYNDRFMNKEILDQCTVVTIGADRRLSYQLSYTNKWTLLSKLMKRFHKSLMSDEDRVNNLKESFENIKSIFDEVPEFTNFRTGLQNQFESMIQNMTYRLSLDFSAYDPSNFFHSLRVSPVEGTEVRNIEELGTGEEQVLALAFAHAYAKAFHGGIVLVIEEPEAHLHPQAQTWLAKKINEFAADGLQVVLSTHSPAFIDIMNLDGLVLVKKENKSTIAKQLDASMLTEFCVKHGGDQNKISPETILPFYAGHQTNEILSGLFARKIILVEGDTEEFALKILLERIGLENDKTGISIIPVFGKGNLAKWWRFFNAYEIPVYVIFDNDNEDDKDCSRRKDILSTLNVDETLSITKETDWLNFDKFSVFGVNFETTMRSHFPDYSSIEQSAKEIFGSSKPLVARYVAENINFVPGSLGYKKLEELKTKILSLQPIVIVESVDDDNQGSDDSQLDFNDDFDNEEYPF